MSEPRKLVAIPTLFSFPIIFSPVGSKAGTITIPSPAKNPQIILWKAKVIFTYFLNDMLRHSSHEVFFNYVTLEHFIVEIFTGHLNIQYNEVDSTIRTPWIKWKISLLHPSLDWLSLPFPLSSVSSCPQSTCRCIPFLWSVSKNFPIRNPASESGWIILPQNSLYPLSLCYLGIGKEWV